MHNKKRLHKHLLVIYIIYFAALIVGFAASFVPGFSRGWESAQNTLSVEIPQGGVRSYFVTAPVVRTGGEPVEIDNLPANITPTVTRLDLRVTVNEPYTVGNAFKITVVKRAFQDVNHIYHPLFSVNVGITRMPLETMLVGVGKVGKRNLRHARVCR